MNPGLRYRVIYGCLSTTVLVINYKIQGPQVFNRQTK
jgi:hypothetical protein